MSNKIITMLVIISFSLSAGCLWRDDFRDRLQPQPLEMPLRGSLNPESLDYAGDPICEKTIEEKTTVLPSIDALAPLPDLPEHPAGVDCD